MQTASSFVAAGIDSDPAAPSSLTGPPLVTGRPDLVGQVMDSCLYPPLPFDVEEEHDGSDKIYLLDL